MVGCVVSGFTGFSCVCLLAGLIAGLMCSFLRLVVSSKALFGWVPIGFGFSVGFVCAARVDFLRGCSSSVSI